MGDAADRSCGDRASAPSTAKTGAEAAEAGGGCVVSRAGASESVASIAVAKTAGGRKDRSAVSLAPAPAFACAGAGGVPSVAPAAGTAVSRAPVGPA